MFAPQDVEDEPTLPETSAAEPALVMPSPAMKSSDVATTAVVADSHVADDEMAEETVGSSMPYLVYAVALLFMMTVPCAFYICKGPRWMLLRRFVHKARAGGYRRVNPDDDVEK